MSPVQIFLIALFIYLGSIGSIVGNTIGWYTLGRPLVAAFVVGLIMDLLLPRDPKCYDSM